jgi:hypothetical protein
MKGSSSGIYHTALLGFGALSVVYHCTEVARGTLFRKLDVFPSSGKYRVPYSVDSVRRNHAQSLQILCYNNYRSRKRRLTTVGDPPR